MDNQLEAYNRARKDEIARSAPAFVQDVSDSLILQQNWGDLLSAAPLSLSLLGACQIAASSPKAASVILEPPQGGFKYLKYKTLQANLTQLGNFGRSSFLEAERRMDKLMMHAKYMFGSRGVANEIISLLCDEEAAKKGLHVQMLTLKKGADDCAKDAKAIEMKFEQWLEMAYELEETAEDNAGDYAGKEKETDILKEIEAIKLNEAEKIKNEREKIVGNMQKVLDTTEEAFKQASKNIPTGWNGLALHIVKGYNETIMSGMNGCTQALKSVFGVVAETGRESAGTQKPPVHPDANDPAFHRAGELCVILSTLVQILTGGEDGGLDLDTIMNFKQTSDSQPTGLTFCRTSLKLMMDQTGLNPTTWHLAGAPSKTLQNVIRESLRIIGNVSSAVERFRNLKAKEIDQHQIKEWQSRASKAYEQALALKARGAMMPGSGSGGGVPFLDPDMLPKPTKSDSSASAFLSDAVNNLKISQSALKAAGDNYSTSTDKFLESTAKFHDIQNQLDKLNAQKATFVGALSPPPGEIRGVLRASIRALSDLKAQISAILQFFQGVSAMVEFVVENPCKRLLDTLHSGIEGEGHQIAGISYTEFQKQTLLTSTLMVRGYFSVVFDIAKVYTEVSRKHIMPGMNLMDRLGLTDPADPDYATELERKKIALRDYSSKAMADIQELAGRRQFELKARLSQKIEKIADTTKFLPPTPQTQVIKDAIAEEKRVDEENIAKKPSSMAASERLLMPDIDDDSSTLWS
ncbi:hypothetical protein MMC11_006254 [Xylographa trunciseda]|nr:hypothetical protein [Xylographa trunciseda]